MKVPAQLHLAGKKPVQRRTPRSQRGDALLSPVRQWFEKRAQTHLTGSQSMRAAAWVAGAESTSKRRPENTNENENHIGGRQAGFVYAGAVASKVGSPQSAPRKRKPGNGRIQHGLKHPDAGNDELKSLRQPGTGRIQQGSKHPDARNDAFTSVKVRGSACCLLGK